MRWSALSTTSKKHPRILAIASAGGHWVQLRRMRSAFDSSDTLWVTTDRGYAGELEPGERLAIVPDANRWQKIRLAISAVRIALLVLSYRPSVVVTTGAAPGFFALRLAKLIGARTMWIDSIANADELSMSGRLALKVADEVLTQWPHLATGERPRYEGAVV